MKIAQIRHGLNQEYALDVRIQEEGDPDFNKSVYAFRKANTYRDLGYFIMRELIPKGACDDLVKAFQSEIKPYQGSLYRQISTENEPHKIKHGLMVNGFLNTHDLFQFPKFHYYATELIADGVAQSIIHDITDFWPTLIESTFWETTRVGTPLHRDGDYVNSARGILTAMWVALEDIGPAQGPLCLVPRSHRPAMWDVPYNKEYDEYDKEVKIPTFNKQQDKEQRFKQGALLHRAIQNAGLPVIAPRLNKGDAIFWDGMVVHGSLPPAPGATRYSIAGHYIPSDDVLIKHGRLVEFESQVVNGMKLRIVLPNSGE